MATGISRRADDRRPMPREVVSDERLQAAKRRFVLGLNGVAAAGCVLAWQQAVHHGVTPADIGLFLFMYAVTGIGITVGYHRLFAHGSFETTPAMRSALAIAGSMAGHGPVISWTATHRCHHKYSDVANDPHSPHLSGDTVGARLRGLWHAHMGWLLGPDLPNSMIFAKDLLHDSRIQRISRLYLWWIALGLAVPALVGGLVAASVRGAFEGLLWGGFVRLFVSFHMTCSVNSITHSFGSRPFNTRERSTNAVWLAVPTLGEGWHNNHHAFPGSAQFGLRWWQIDLGYMVIRILGRLNLAWSIKRPGKSQQRNRSDGPTDDPQIEWLPDR